MGARPRSARWLAPSTLCAPGLLALLALLGGCVTGRYSQLETLQFDQIKGPGLMAHQTVGGHRLAFFQAGLGAPVLLLHGLGEHAGYYNENLEGLLRGGLRVIVPDLLGFGRSDKPQGAYRLSEQARLLVGLLDQLGVEGPVTVVGHSMGGQIALHLALAWPERVKALVLLAPAGIETFTPGEARWLKEVSTTAAFKARDEAQLRAHYEKNVFGRWSEAAEHHLEERVRLRRARDFEPYLYAVVKSIHAMLDEPVADRLGALEPPVTVVFGDRDGLIPNPILHGDDPESVAEKARRRMPRARVEVLAGLGHMLQIEDPAAVNAIILRAVAEVGPKGRP